MSYSVGDTQGHVILSVYPCVCPPRYPCFENPYPMDIHESPVTGCLYLADCPHDLIPAFYSVGSKQKKTGFSEKVSLSSRQDNNNDMKTSIPSKSWETREKLIR